MSKEEKKDIEEKSDDHNEKEISRRKVLKKGFSAAIAGLLFGAAYSTLTSGCIYDDSYSDYDDYDDYYSDYYSDSYYEYSYYNYSDSYYEYYSDYYYYDNYSA